jgi:hypothetical protein
MLVKEAKRKPLQQGDSQVIQETQRENFGTSTAQNEICHLQSRPSEDK